MTGRYPPGSRCVRCNMNVSGKQRHPKNVCYRCYQIYKASRGEDDYPNNETDAELDALIASRRATMPIEMTTGSGFYLSGVPGEYVEPNDDYRRPVTIYGEQDLVTRAICEQNARITPELMAADRWLQHSAKEIGEPESIWVGDGKVSVMMVMPDESRKWFDFTPESLKRKKKTKVRTKKQQEMFKGMQFNVDGERVRAARTPELVLTGE